MYNDWFMRFAPAAYRETRIQTTKDVESTLEKTANLTKVSPALLRREPGVLPTLRMSACPPLAVDRLIGLARVSRNLVGCMEGGTIPPRMSPTALEADLKKIANIIERMVDPDIFAWLERSTEPTEAETYRAATIVADRLCGAVANPVSIGYGNTESPNSPDSVCDVGTIAELDERRVALQESLDSLKTQKERNRLGQFATPSLLAADILAHARKLLPAIQPVRFLEPAFGTGAGAFEVIS